MRLGAVREPLGPSACSESGQIPRNLPAWKDGDGIINMSEGPTARPARNARTLPARPFAMKLTAINLSLLPGEGRARMADEDRRRRNEQGGPGTAVITKTKPQTKRPSMYRVLILNDDYTPMEFVVHVLERFFGKDHEAATRIMLHVHHHGIGECGVYTYEVAETKVTQVMDFARKHQHPLQCVMEKK
jgi:ATP-dependent Clp protease adaptor protein ClpS